MNESFYIERTCSTCGNNERISVSKKEAAFELVNINDLLGPNCPNCSSTSFSFGCRSLDLDFELLKEWALDLELHVSPQDEEIILAEEKYVESILSILDGFTIPDQKRNILIGALCVIIYDNTVEDNHQKDRNLKQRIIRELNSRIEILKLADDSIMDYIKEVVHPQLELNRTEELKSYEASIKREHRFGWTPKFQDVFQTDLNKTVFVPIVIQTFERLGWDLVYQDENSAEAKRKGEFNRGTEKITVSYDQGNVEVISISLGSELWDAGRNSKRVRLFEHAFRQLEDEYDAEALAELEKEVERTNNWDDYVIPESLPLPKKQKTPKLWIPVTGGLISAILLGFILALLTTKVMYVFVLYEVGIAIAFGLVLKFLIRSSNYTYFNHLKYTLMGMTGLAFFSSQYFQYQIFLNEIGEDSFGFLAFMNLRLQMGLTLESLNTGWIGLVLSWIFQLGFTYLVGIFRLASILISYQLERVPPEVLDFALFHFTKEKTEDQVRSELSRMGWTEAQDQNEVFEAIGALNGAIEHGRM
ncbi:hypothetical protein [Sanyastnella coralliicola]|uniref:hypothetical protein n=1 Tax=Sanyastnella coralliicola TaxID=3069118 RepID=UPI0027BA24E1|nr:hypothetical protein [Longitalea sp. SCSIO 12813]